jgi:predicted GIY-YIG superfamily endonuclease
MTTGCYLLHFSPSYKQARHYLGFAEDIEPRVYAHLHGKGARLTQVAHEAGITMWLTRVWVSGDRKTERKLKNRKSAPALCPICSGSPVQLPLLRWMPATVPQEQVEEEESEHDLCQPPASNPLFDIDYEAELCEYTDDILDREDWMRGGW